MTKKQKTFMRKVAAKLRRLRHEEHYDQGTFIKKKGCGTAACVAGWAVLMDGWKGDKEDDWYCIKGNRNEAVEDVAARLLGTDDLGFDLFTPDPDGAYEPNWPEEYAKRWASGTERKSRIAADLLTAIADGRVK